MQVVFILNVIYFLPFITSSGPFRVLLLSVLPMSSWRGHAFLFWNPSLKDLLLKNYYTSLPIRFKQSFVRLPNPSSSMRTPWRKTRHPQNKSGSLRDVQSATPFPTSLSSVALTVVTGRYLHQETISNPDQVLRICGVI